jgi:hypothetical protein
VGVKWWKELVLNAEWVRERERKRKKKKRRDRKKEAKREKNYLFNK